MQKSLDQLITHYECQDNPGDWNDHRFREVSDHLKITPLFHASGVCPTSPAISAG